MFKSWARSDQWLLRYSTINILRLSSNLGCLPWMMIFILCICNFCLGHINLSLKFEQYLIRVCWVCLPVKFFYHGRSSSFYKLYLGHISLCLNFEQDPISGCGDTPLSIFWGCLSIEILPRLDRGSWYISLSILWGCVPIKLIFHGHRSLNIKLEQDPLRNCWNVLLSKFWGCLLIKVVFQGKSSSFYGFVNFALVK